MRYVPNVCCTIAEGRLMALRDQLFLPIDQERLLTMDLTVSDLAVLELFCHHSDPAEVFERLKRNAYSTAAADLGQPIAAEDRGQRLAGASTLRIFLGKGRVVAMPTPPGADTVEPVMAVDLSLLSRRDPRVALALISGRVQEDMRALETSNNYEAFQDRVEGLFEEGLLAPDVGAIDWGDLRRRHPLCQAFGYLRGTPLDRYYLHKFVEQNRGQIHGKVLEVGGKRFNKTVYGFVQATEYRTLDLAGAGDDIIGDASDPAAVPEAGFDSIVAFHVLEHCEKPHIVVDNFWRWLSPGGTAYVAVPAAQKIHTFPRDYWRPQPDALRGLFRRFSRIDLHIYGNLAAVIAGLFGIAAEELSAAERDAVHPDYPVLACVAARK